MYVLPISSLCPYTLWFQGLHWIFLSFRIEILPVLEVCLDFSLNLSSTSKTMYMWKRTQYIFILLVLFPVLIAEGHKLWQFFVSTKSNNFLYLGHFLQCWFFCFSFSSTFLFRAHFLHQNDFLLQRDWEQPSLYMYVFSKRKGSERVV